MTQIFSNRQCQVIGGSLAIALIIAGAIIYRSSSDRYYLTTLGNGQCYKIDRRTGQTWLVRGTSLIEVSSGPITGPTDKLTEAPPEVVAKITGRGNYHGGTSHFLATLYNGSEWHIRAVRLSIQNKPERLIPLWSRTFSKDVTLDPESSCSLSLDTVDGDMYGATEWEIVSALGYKK